MQRHRGILHQHASFHERRYSRVPLLVGISISAIVGYLAIAALIRYLERRSFRIFIIYRVALGVLVLALGWGMRQYLG